MNVVTKDAYIHIAGITTQNVENAHSRRMVA